MVLLVAVWLLSAAHNFQTTYENQFTHGNSVWTTENMFPLLFLALAEAFAMGLGMVASRQIMKAVDSDELEADARSLRSGYTRAL